MIKVHEKYQRIQFLNCYFDNVGFNEVRATLEEHIEKRQPGFMVSVNVDIVVKIDADPDFAEAFKKADLALIDSQPLMKIANRQGIAVAEKLSGSDLMPKVCELAGERGWSCFFLGGSAGVPVQAAKCMQTKYPKLTIAGAFSPQYGFEKDPHLLAETIYIVSESHADILFVCLGAPKAEKFLASNLGVLNIPFSFSVGAAVDFAAGNKKRAPLWMQHIGLEWLHRFIQEPRRLFRRYFIESWHLLSILKQSKRRAG